MIGCHTSLEVYWMVVNIYIYISGWLLMCVNSSKWLFMIHDYHLLMTSNWRTNSILATVDSVDCWWFPQLKELFVRNYLCWLVLWYNVYIYIYIHILGVPTIGVPPFIQNQTTLVLKPMVLGYPRFRKPPFPSMKFNTFHQICSELGMVIPNTENMKNYSNASTSRGDHKAGIVII